MNRIRTLLVELFEPNRTKNSMRVFSAIMKIEGVCSITALGEHPDAPESSDHCERCGRPKSHPADGDDLDRCAGPEFTSCMRFTEARERGRQDERRRISDEVSKMPVALTIHARPATREAHRNDGKYVEIDDIQKVIGYSPDFDE
jgi:hypothetical protein